MRIWHSFLLNSLPDQLLKAQHRDCCAIRGKAWGRSKTSKMRWLWNYPIQAIELYHLAVLDEMSLRGWKASELWRVAGYRGKKSKAIPKNWIVVPDDWPNGLMFTEHGPAYMARDLKDLRSWVEGHKVSEKERLLLGKWI